MLTRWLRRFDRALQDIVPGLPPNVAALPAGTLVLFDDRILHRGGGNASSDCRYVGYFSYKRNWVPCIPAHTHTHN